MNNGEADQTGEQVKREFSELVKTMRSVSRKANSRVSASMDTAIIAGGLVGGNVKAIQTKTHDLHNQSDQWHSGSCLGIWERFCGSSFGSTEIGGKYNREFKGYCRFFEKDH
jgi:hypothetical protein